MEEIKKYPEFSESAVNPEVDLTKSTCLSRITEEEQTEYVDVSQSKSTKNDTTLASGLSQDDTELFGSSLHLTVVSAEELSEKLKKIYSEAKTKQGEQYHKSTIKSIRSGLKKANEILVGTLKSLANGGTRYPTIHAIGHNDLQKIANYFNKVELCPQALRQAVWYYLSVHFLSHGQEFLKELQMSSLEFNTDDNGVEYVTLSHEYQQDQFKGGLNSPEAPNDKRMYATGKRNCPVRLLRLLIKKTDKSALFLFNQCAQDVIYYPEEYNIWYRNQQLSGHCFESYMPDIAKSSGCSRRYTIHCLLTTAKTTDCCLRASFHQSQKQ